MERARLEKVLFSSLDELLALEGVAERWDQQRWARLFVEGLWPFIENLRDVRRFAGTLAFHVSLFRRLSTFEVNPVDLVGLEVLRVFEPTVYRALPSAKPVLTRHPRDSAIFGGGDQDERRRTVEGVLDQATAAHRDATIEILKELFPPAAWAFGGQTYSGFEDQWLRELRVCHPDVFDRYFLLAIPQQDVSQADLDRLLAHAGNRDRVVEELKAFEQRGLLRVALERLEAYKQEIDLAHAVPFVTALFDVGDSLSDEPDEFFGISPAMHAVRIVHWYVKKEPDARKRGRILKDAVGATSGLFLPVMKVSLEDAREGGERDPDAYAVEAADLSELKALCVEKIREAAESGVLRSHPRLKYVLYRWREWASREEVAKWINQMIETNEGLLDFLQRSLHKSRSLGTGEYLMREKVELRLKEIEDFLPVEAVESRVAEVDEAELTEEQRQAVDAFKRALQRRAEGMANDDWD